MKIKRLTVTILITATTFKVLRPSRNSELVSYLMTDLCGHESFVFEKSCLGGRDDGTFQSPTRLRLNPGNLDVNRKERIENKICNTVKTNKDNACAHNSSR